MATITTIDSGDLISDSRADINTNFANLNSDKIETSVLDTDTSFAANSDTKIATQKATKAYVDAFVGAVSVASASAATLSLTTTSTQTVVVWAKGNVDVSFAGGSATAALKYNGVTKDSVTATMSAGNAQNGTVPFALMYTEAPGAGTQDITVDGGTVSNVDIIVLKLG